MNEKVAGRIQELFHELRRTQSIEKRETIKEEILSYVAGAADASLEIRAVETTL